MWRNPRLPFSAEKLTTNKQTLGVVRLWNCFPLNFSSACYHMLRLIRLLEEIMSEKENKTIIFVETKRRCDELTRRMRRDG